MPPSASQPATTSRALIVVADTIPGPGGNAAPTTVKLIHPDGTVANSLNVKAGVELLRAAGSRIFIKEPGALKAIHADGSVEDLGPIDDQIFGFAASPDGSRWMWGTIDSNNQGQVHVAGTGIAPRVVAQSHQDAVSIQPFSWTPVAPFLVHAKVGIGGYILFSPANGPVEKLDSTSLTPTAMPQTDRCAFSDMARDGTIACFSGTGQQSRGLNLIAADGKTTTIQLAVPRFAQDGDAYFSPDGKQVTVAGAESVGNAEPAQPERYGTDLILVKDASIQRLTLDGVRLAPYLQAQSWLDDGSLVVWRPDKAAGGPPGIFVVSPSGAARQISQGGFAVGVLTR
jgi:hypothetical protein